MGNDGPSEWRIMHFQVCDELRPAMREFTLLGLSGWKTHVIFKVFIYVLKCPCRD